jgi:4-diphosphocytidyl-2-C-methyl-D-erythritol kinase
VPRRRPDGYHDIETLFVPYFGMSDVLEIVPSDKLRFVPSDNVTWQDDLTLRAYSLLKSDFDLPPVEIRLEKRSAVGAGLGGGSADAAFTLMALTDMFKLPLEDWQLADYAACLGSDCSFFIYNRPMIGEGRGDVLSEYELDLSGYEIRVEVPEGVRVSTSEAYSRVIPRDRLALPPLRESLRYPVEMWPDVLFNDFESSVFPLHPEVRALKERFYAEGAAYASMSGSGSAVFGLFKK